MRAVPIILTQASTDRNTYCVGPRFPQFSSAPEGGITAWYTMRLTQLADGIGEACATELASVLKEYNTRDSLRVVTWNEKFHKHATRNDR